MKNVLEIKFGLMNQDLAVCLTKKAYRKKMKQLGVKDQIISLSGVCTTLFKPGMYDRYIIGIDTKKDDDILSIKGLMVHELNHLVTKHMLEFKFDCDEYRSSLLQFVYTDTITFIDDFFDKLKSKK